MLKSYWKKFWYLFINTIYVYLHPISLNAIFLNGWINCSCGKIRKRNFGDELNVYLLEKLVSQPVVIYKSWFHRSRTNYMMIGSLIDGFTDSKSIVWGSGIISDKSPLIAKPQKVCAVRGKITRDYLCHNGVECPEIYGDPALLTPYVYQPDVDKKYTIGVIPHISDFHDVIVEKFVTAYKDDVCLINFADYDDWHEVIDKICSCRYIISSSLHGLILSDAYGIPNLWIRISDRVKGGDCKFLDYFSGVNRKTKSAFVMDEDTDLSDIMKAIADYECIDYDVKPLLKSCPFKLNL